MDFKVIWSDTAIEELRSICNYVAMRNPEAAGCLGNGILNHVRILSTFPFIGPTYPRGSRGPLREISYRPYRVFYDVAEESRTVKILHVWHGARDEPAFSP